MACPLQLLRQASQLIFPTQTHSTLPSTLTANTIKILQFETKNSCLIKFNKTNTCCSPRLHSPVAIKTPISTSFHTFNYHTLPVLFWPLQSIALLKLSLVVVRQHLIKMDQEAVCCKTLNLRTAYLHS